MSEVIERFYRRLIFLFQRHQFRRDLAEELATHETLKFSEHLASGLDERTAAEKTKREMGNVTLALDRSADVRTFVSLEAIMLDVQYALRLMRKHMGFSTVAVLSLALGIGGSVALFSILNALLIRPLPFGEPGRLVRITEFFPKALLVHLRQQSRTMEIAVAGPGTEENVTGQGPAFRMTASAVSANLFQLLRAPAQLGRTFEPSEDGPGRDHVVILSDQEWRSHYAADPSVIDRVITLDGIDRRVVGVMPPDFRFPSTGVQAWIPATLDPTNPVDYWGGQFTPLIGRLKDQATLSQAKTEIHALAADLWQRFPWPMPRNFNANATVISLQSDLAGEAQARVFVLMCTVAAVLVIACANIAGLLTARGAARSREMAMRSALGAGQGRIARQLLIESLVLAAVAGVAGVILASFGINLFLSLLPADLPQAAAITMDWRVVLFACALSLIAGLAFGIAPALNATRMSIVMAIKSGGQRAAGVQTTRFRSTLIAVEVALTFVLVVGAALLLRSLHSMTALNPGFDAERVVAMKMSLDPAFCRQREACIAYYNRLQTEASRLSGMTGVTVANTVPMDGEAPALPVDLEDHPKSSEFPAPMFWAGAVTPHYFQLMRIPIVAGRLFSDADTINAEPVVVIDQSTARRFWRNQNPIGKHIKWVSESQWRKVVGVVADVRQFNLSNRTPAGITGTLYMPYPQSITGAGHIPSVMNLIVRVSTNAPGFADEVRRLAVALNPNTPVGPVIRLQENVGNSVTHLRSTTWLFLSFAGVALALAVLGIYGLVSWSVAQRSYEIALRMAIGASRTTIFSMVLARSLRVSLAGLALGVGGAILAARLMTRVLADVAPAQPGLFVLVAVFLLLIALAASLVPALRAIRLDPARLLRAD